MNPVNLAHKLTLFTKQWHPHLIAEGDSLQVYLSKLQGEFVMHAHENGDELFYVVKGRMEMRFKDGTVEVGEGEIILVPRGVEHAPGPSRRRGPRPGRRAARHDPYGQRPRPADDRRLPPDIGVGFFRGVC